MINFQVFPLSASPTVNRDVVFVVCRFCRLNFSIQLQHAAIQLDLIIYFSSTLYIKLLERYMKKILITGANKGIGFETVRQLLQKGYYVYLGSRNSERGKEAVEKLNAAGFSDVELVVLDVSDPESIKAARAEIGAKTKVLDVLINNAGISGVWPQTVHSDVSVFKEVYGSNFFGAVEVTQRFLDLLEQSEAPRIVNVSSSLASLTLHNDPKWKFYQAKGAAYNSSKTALNMYTVHLAYELRETSFKVNVVDPGFTATDLNGFTGTDSVEVAAGRLIKAVMIDHDGPTGQFFSDDTDSETGICPW